MNEAPAALGATMRIGAAALGFSYARGVAPILWALVVLSGIELLVVHLLIWFWSPTAAAVLTGISLLTIAWLVRAIRSFAGKPVLIDGDFLLWRTGSLVALEVPLANVAGVRTAFPGEDVKRRDTLDAALVAYPNVIVDLKDPVRRRRRHVARLAHKLDDPVAFAAALSERIDTA